MIGTISETNFQSEVLDSALPVLVFFSVVWQGTCRSTAPHVEATADQFQGVLKVVKIDGDSNMRTVSRYGVTAFPTLVVFKDGTEVDRLGGDPGSYTAVLRLVEPHLG
jgi:thioredoxin 1